MKSRGKHLYEVKITGNFLVAAEDMKAAIRWTRDNFAKLQKDCSFDDVFFQPARIDNLPYGVAENDLVYGFDNEDVELREFLEEEE